MQTCGMPRADMRAWLAKPRPPGTKISAWYSRLAPPDSTRWTIGSLFSSTICCTRWPLRWPEGATVPPLIAEFEADTTQRTPST